MEYGWEEMFIDTKPGNCSLLIVDRSRNVIDVWFYWQPISTIVYLLVITHAPSFIARLMVKEFAPGDRLLTNKQRIDLKGC
jgi:hypothetical protein